MNLGIPLLQFQVPTWLGELEILRPNHTSVSFYASNQQKQLCFRRKACTCLAKEGQLTRFPSLSKKNKLQRSMFHKLKHKLPINARSYHMQV